MNDHTPGPWKVREHGTAVHVGNKILCRVNAAAREPMNMRDEQEMAKANARLIAAAPDLLEELFSVLEWAVVEAAPLRAQEIESIRAVIKKAIGG